MSLRLFSALFKPLQLVHNGPRISATGIVVQERHKCKYEPPRRRYPPWVVKQNRVKYDEMLTPESSEFIQEVIQDQYGPRSVAGGVPTYLHTPLKQEPILRGTWFKGCRRSGLIGIKIGVLPQWAEDGTQFLTTLIQILDNHVIKYIPPEEFVVNQKRSPKRFVREGQLGCLIVGAVNCDPQMFTKDYVGLFSKAGVMPKRLLTRFPIHPCAAIQPGTPLYAAHFRVGDYLDVSGVTIYRGFQGVMKRWGFKGGRASHGTTKSHRRPGNIGGGGQKGRVWPGTKMPGDVGYKLRTLRGLKVWRIDHKNSVLYLNGVGVPGNVNDFVYLHDTILPLRELTESPRFPTYYPEDYVDKPLPEEEYAKGLFHMSDPTIIFPEEKSVKKK